MRRDGKKEIPVSIRCLTVLLRCQHDSSTDLLRLMTAALRFTKVELRMLTNAHDASTIRYGASTIQAGSATVASRPPTNLHDLVVAMRQSRGGGILSFFLHTLARAQHLPFIPPPQKKNRNFKNPKKYLKFLQPPKIPQFCTLTLKKTQKCIEMTPKYSLIL